MTDVTCSQVRDRLEELVHGVLHGALDERTSAHLASCGACARLVARQRRLELLLTSLPAAPRAELAPPVLPARRGRLFVMRPPVWAATAAASVVVAAAWAWSARSLDHVRVERVVDVADAPPPVDEPLLALTAGVEAVAMRRPTEMR